MRRLQRIRVSTAEAIRHELDQRRRATEAERNVPIEIRRALDAEREYRSETGVRDRTASSSRVPETHLGSRGLFIKPIKRTKLCRLLVQPSHP